MSDLSPPDREVGALIIGNVDDDGYLRSTVDEIAEAAGVDAECVETVLAVVQDFDPFCCFIFFSIPLDELYGQK